MARLLTNGPVDLQGVDWAALRTGATITLETGVNDTVGSLVYRDVLVVDGPGGPLWLWGEGLVADPQGRLVGGTVQAIAQGGSRLAPDWIVQQITLAATLVSGAVWSATTADDLAVLRAGLVGDDILRMGDAGNRAFGGFGNDTLHAGRGHDTLFGDNGHDLIESFFGNDLIYGGWGNDTIRASADNDTVYGGAGDDVIGATSGANRFWGGDGRDSLTGGSGTDTLRGDAGADTLQAWAGDDLAAGGDGDDRLWGGTGNDRLFGGQGDDQLSGGRHDDRLEGGAGRDTLDGDNGNDSLLGGSEADVLRGSNGSDTLAGGTGRDTLEGGTGTDVFVFAPNGGIDTITDFTAGAILFNDRLQLSAALWAAEGALDAAGVVARFAGVGPDGFVRLTFAEGKTTIILHGVTDADLLIPQIDIL